MNWELLPAPSSRPADSVHIGLLNKAEDFNAVLLAAMGWSNKAITKVTGLTTGQIHYRLKRAEKVLGPRHLTRHDFREGTSALITPMYERYAAKHMAGPLTESLRQLQLPNSK